MVTKEPSNLRPGKGNVLLRWHCHTTAEISWLAIEKSSIGIETFTMDITVLRLPRFTCLLSTVRLSDSP